MHTPDNNLAARVFISTTSLRRFVDIIPHPDTLGFLRATGGWGARMHVDTRVRAPGLSLVTLAAARLSQFVDLQRCTRSVLI